MKNFSNNVQVCFYLKTKQSQYDFNSIIERLQIFGYDYITYPDDEEENVKYLYIIMDEKIKFPQPWEAKKILKEVLKNCCIKTTEFLDKSITVGYLNYEKYDVDILIDGISKSKDFFNHIITIKKTQLKKWK